ncbi:protein of unknown function, might releated with Uncharacterized protein ycf73 [Shewanella benthica]|uniref:Uncharacterized protein n=1 Tax=Shewanella benthica TaxID=43661 RepID=A0A330M5B4_9GAMM|nr:protein of unknown function, might releated with Uncharacterized protein ycf73 [Shewanella benthica]
MDKQICYSPYIRFGIYLSFLLNAPAIVKLRLYVEYKLVWSNTIPSKYLIIQREFKAL